MKEKYSIRGSNFLNEIQTDIFNKLPFKEVINEYPCSVVVLNDDFCRIWVKWGPYDCSINELPISALCTIADEILFVESNKSKS